MLFAFEARSQFHWQVSHSDFDGKNYYIFNSLSCLENNCVVAGSIVDGETYQTSLTLWNSADGGVSWVPVNAGVPATELATRRRFTDIHHIHERNIIAVGDSGLMIRSIDNGATWMHQSYGSSGDIKRVHFIDSLTGILIAYSGIQLLSPVMIHTTLDGGKTWNHPNFTALSKDRPGDFAQCQSYGGQRFSAFRGNGPLYITNDNWQTVDSVEIKLEGLADPENYGLGDCMIAGDTIIAFGNYRPNGDFLNSQGLFIRSIDGGGHWSPPMIFKQFGSIRGITDIRRDTIFATGTSTGYILRSIDKGASWQLDTLILDTSYAVSWMPDIAITSSGEPVAIAVKEAKQNVPSILVKRKFFPSSVKTLASNNFNVYPNPASVSVNFETEEGQYRIVDVLGKLVAQFSQSSAGMMTINCSSYSNGIYSIFRKHNGQQSRYAQFVVFH